MTTQSSSSDARCGSAFSGSLEHPADDHRIRVRLLVGKHRALAFHSVGVRYGPPPSLVGRKEKAAPRAASPQCPPCERGLGSFLYCADSNCSLRLVARPCSRPRCRCELVRYMARILDRYMSSRRQGCGPRRPLIGTPESSIGSNVQFQPRGCLIRLASNPHYWAPSSRPASAGSAIRPAIFTTAS